MVESPAGSALVAAAVPAARPVLGEAGTAGSGRWSMIAAWRPWRRLVQLPLHLVEQGPVGELDGPAQRIAQQLAAEMTHELVAALREQVIAQAVDIGERGPVLQAHLRVDGSSAQVGLAAPADRIVSLPARSRRGRSDRGTCARLDAAVLLGDLPHGQAARVELALGQLGHVLGRLGQLLAQQRSRAASCPGGWGWSARRPDCLASRAAIPSTPPRPCALTPSTRRHSGPLTPGMP